MREKTPDKKNAFDIVEEARRQMNYTLTLQIDNNSAFTIVRNIYECFRMLGNAVLVSQGKQATDHIDMIGALLKLDVNTRRPISTIDNLRRMRHRINYYGYHPSLAEAKDSVDIAIACFEPLFDAVKKQIEHS